MRVQLTEGSHLAHLQPTASHSSQTVSLSPDIWNLVCNELDEIAPEQILIAIQSRYSQQPKSLIIWAKKLDSKVSFLTATLEAS